MTEATILIVEDDGILALHLEDMLSRMGYSVSGPLATGEEALALLAEQQIDLVLMDIELAGSMNGITTAERLHQTMDVPIVFLTGFSQDPLLEQAKIAAPYGYLIKPVPERELAATVEMALHRHALDRKLLESQQALAASESRYRHLFEHSPLGIFRSTIDGRFLAINTEMARLIGCSTAEEVVNGFTNLADQLYVDPDRRRQFITLLGANGAVEHFEFEVRKKNGETGWLSMNARLTPAEESNGEGAGEVIDGFAIDINDRRRAEQTLRLSEKLLRDIADNIPGALYQFIRKADGTYEIPFISEGATELLGQPVALLRDTDRLFENVHPDDQPLMWQSINVSFETMTRWRQEFRVFRPSGEIRWLQGASLPTRQQGGSTCWNGVILDITERKEAEHNYQTLFREMLDGFALHEMITDDAGRPVNYRFLAVNPAFEKMTGLEAEKIINRTVLDIFTVTEPHWIETYGKVAETGEPACFSNYSAALDKHFEVTAFRPAPGQFACIFIDISERKRAEEETKRLQKQLQQAQKMEAIGTLAGGIAHDFNNILGAILGYAEMARDDIADGSQIAGDLDQVIKAGNRAKDLVRQILAFSRQVEGRKIHLHPDLIIKETVKLLRASLPSTISIDIEAPPDIGVILADPTEIHQVLMNLCTNAYHAMEESGGTLSISLRRKRLGREDLAGNPGILPGDFVQLSVGDTGTGITPEVLDKIFDPYFSTKETGKGTGLGLSIVHGIVKSCDGFITCHSHPGTGTLFNIMLPALAPSLEPEEKAMTVPPVGCEKILFIDDEEVLGEMAQTMLERLGYQVTVRLSSLEALTTFENQPEAFDLVITDQTMPGITGMDLARLMLQIRPQLPIILCTGYSNLISEDKAKAIGIRGFAFKPLAKNDIATLIRKVLGPAVETR